MAKNSQFSSRIRFVASGRWAKIIFACMLSARASSNGRFESGPGDAADLSVPLREPETSVPEVSEPSMMMVLDGFAG